MVGSVSWADLASPAHWMTGLAWRAAGEMSESESGPDTDGTVIGSL
jgi:hypothetical protein